MPFVIKMKNQRYRVRTSEDTTEDETEYVKRILTFKNNIKMKQMNTRTMVMNREAIVEFDAEIGNTEHNVNVFRYQKKMNKMETKGYIAGINHNTLNVDDDGNEIFDLTISRVYKTKTNAINWLVRNYSNVTRDNNNRYYLFEATVDNDSVEPGEFVFVQAERKFEEEYVTPAMYKKVAEKMNKIFNY